MRMSVWYRLPSLISDLGPPIFAIDQFAFRMGEFLGGRLRFGSSVGRFLFAIGVRHGFFSDDLKVKCVGGENGLKIKTEV
jgi:hypothetical protein